MRVITGSARGRKLAAPEGLETRPSSDMTKQAVFNILQNYLKGCRFLDLFAGSGQMGIEALSRGASTAVFLDSSPKAVAVVKENLRSCGLMERARVSMGDGISYLRNAPAESFDIVFLDPPYQQGLMEEALPLAARLLAPGGFLVCETERREQLPLEAGDVSQSKTYQYGRAKLTVYRRPGPEEG